MVDYVIMLSRIVLDQGCPNVLLGGQNLNYQQFNNSNCAAFLRCKIVLEPQLPVCLLFSDCEKKRLIREFLNVQFLRILPLWNSLLKQIGNISIVAKIC